MRLAHQISARCCKGRDPEDEARRQEQDTFRSRQIARCPRTRSSRSDVQVADDPGLRQLLELLLPAWEGLSPRDRGGRRERSGTAMRVHRLCRSTWSAPSPRMAQAQRPAHRRGHPEQARVRRCPRWSRLPAGACDARSWRLRPSKSASGPRKGAHGLRATRGHEGARPAHGCLCKPGGGSQVSPHQRT